MFLSKILSALSGGTYSGSELDGLFNFDDAGALWVRVFGATTPPANPAPVATHLASETLPAAGAYTSQAAWSIEAGTTKITCVVTYARGASGGFPRFQALWTTVGGEVRSTELDSSADAVVGRYQLILQDFDGLTPTDGTAVTFAFPPFDVLPGATAFRFLACEAGQPGTPGTCAIALMGSKQ